MHSPTDVLMKEMAMRDLEVQERRSGAREPVPAQAVPVIRVRWQADDRFDIQVRDHIVTVDQPVDVGGDDVGPTPTELFVAGLASCVAFYARRYLRRHHLDPDGLEVTTSYRLDSRPARVGAVDMQIHVPAELSPQRRAGLLAQASHCTVHNSLVHAPEVAITLTQPDGSASTDRRAS